MRERTAWMIAGGVTLIIPTWMFLVDVFMNRQKSLSWYLLDLLRHVLIFGVTALTAWRLWRVNWILGLVSAPVAFVIFLNLFGFLTLPVYRFTREAAAARQAKKDLDSLMKGDRQCESE